VPASGSFGAGHSPTSASEPRALAAHSFSTHRDRASADRRPFGPGTPALPQENVCAGLPRYLWRYLPIKGACFRPEAGQSR
jgi:hypothetical protein